MSSSFKKRIKSYFWGRYLISELHCAESFIVPKLIDDKTAVRRFYKKNTGRDLNLDNPNLFSEKVNWYKLNNKDPLMQQCADKLAVREYIKSKGYGDCLNKLLGIYDRVSDIDIDALPERFVLKASHGSHMNIIVKDKNIINWHQQKLMMRSWLHQDIYWCGREWVYKDIPRRIIAEDYLEDETGELKDYKFFCFDGVPEFVQVDEGRFAQNHARNFYDMDWNLLPFGKEMPCRPDIVIEKPKLFEQMKEMARTLCEPFRFVRVDLYHVKDRAVFGELTFFPAGGMPNFVPEEYDLIVGEKWKIV